jgi:hypothetical protein
MQWHLPVYKILVTACLIPFHVKVDYSFKKKFYLANTNASIAIILLKISVAAKIELNLKLCQIKTCYSSTTNNFLTK